jgi:hypothetical protein
MKNTLPANALLLHYGKIINYEKINLLDIREDFSDRGTSRCNCLYLFKETKEKCE